MKERPILFSAPMVRAILEGRKTQTRRLVKAKHLPFLENLVGNFFDGKWNQRPLPYGQPGDRLWVRETWQDVHPLQVAAGRYSQKGRAGIPGPPPVEYRTIYRADGEYPAVYSLGCLEHPYRRPELFSSADGIQAFEEHYGWTPSIHMPRWASRITLEITGIRVERLHDITSADILAEGVRIPVDADTGNLLIDVSTKYGPSYFVPPGKFGDRDAMLFGHWAALWVEINGIDSWNANPWVWVVEFKRLEAQP